MFRFVTKPRISAPFLIADCFNNKKPHCQYRKNDSQSCDAERIGGDIGVDYQADKPRDQCGNGGVYIKRHLFSFRCFNMLSGNIRIRRRKDSRYRLR